MWRKFGPPRSRFGEWMEEHDISHTEMSKRSGVPDATIDHLASGKTKRPTRLTEKKLRKTIKEIDSNINSSDFWNV